MAIHRFEQSGYDVRAIDSIEATSQREWDELVERSALGSVFHRYDWLRAIESGTDAEPRHVLVTKDTNLVGVLPNFVRDIAAIPVRRLTSLRPGFGGPIVSTDEEQILDLLLETTAEVSDGPVITHLIRAATTEYARYNNYLAEAGYTTLLPDCRFVLDLRDGWESIYDDMDSSRRRGIRQGEERVSVREEDVTERRLRSFYDEYSAVMDRIGGTTYPRSFFASLADMDDRVMIATAVADGDTVGEQLYLLDEERSAVHYFFPGVREEYFDYHSSEMIHKHMIEWGIGHDYRLFDFGSTAPDFRDGLFKYKAGYGAAVVPTLSWERATGFTGNLFQTGRSVYQRATHRWDGLRR